MFPLFMSGTRKKIWRASLRLRLITLGLAPLLVAFPIILGILTIAGGQIFDKLLITNARGNLASAHTYMEQVRSQTLQNIEEMVRSDRLNHMLDELADEAGKVRSVPIDQALAARADAARLDFMIIATGTSNRQIGAMLDKVREELSTVQREAGQGALLRDGMTVVIAGRPNAGKSSIINAFIGEERNIVTEIAGTTRDSIYTRFDKFGFDFYLVDTAGIRRKNKVSEDLEFYSVMRSIRAIENSDVCILMIDATRGIEAQDMNIFQLIQRNNKSLVVVVNKWDLVENKGQAVIKTFENAIRQRMAPFVDFPIIFASALTKQRIFKVLELAKAVFDSRKIHIGTNKLNEVMLPLIEAYPPPSTKGKYIKIKYCTQLPNTQIPSFVFYANLPQYIKEPYRRFLENKIRENWSLHEIGRAHV